MSDKVIDLRTIFAMKQAVSEMRRPLDTFVESNMTEEEALALIDFSEFLPPASMPPNGAA